MLCTKKWESTVSESQFGGPPKNGKQIKVTSGHSGPTPYHVTIWVDGNLKDVRMFASQAEAEKFQKEEVVR
jgi:hypothetical protein